MGRNGEEGRRLVRDTEQRGAGGRRESDSMNEREADRLGWSWEPMKRECLFVRET